MQGLPFNFIGGNGNYAVEVKKSRERRVGVIKI